MASSYPGGLDSFTNPTASDQLDSVTVPHATQHADVNDAVEAVQAELGTNPAGTEATVADRLTAIEAGLPGAPVVSVSAQTGSFTLALTDAATLIEVDASTASTVTVPPVTSVAFPVGTSILVCQSGTGSVGFAAGAGVTLLSAGGATDIAAQYAVASLIHLVPDEWLLSGGIA